MMPGDGLDGDDRLVAFMQYLRVLVVTLLTPLLVPLAFGVHGAGGSADQGPVLGSAGALATLIWAEEVNSNLLRALAYLGFLLNLFNLIPVVPLDGGRAVSALHPAFWFAGLFAIALLFFKYESPILLIVLVFACYELYRRWSRRDMPGYREYHSVTIPQRIGIAVVYLGLVVLAITATGLIVAPVSLHRVLFRRHLKSELVRRLQDPQAGTNGALGVILVRDRCAEHGHHRVADKLLHRAAEPAELLAHPLVVGLQRRAHVFRVGRVGARSERDQVDEEHRDGLALLAEHSGAERCAARQAEAGPLRVLLAAARTDCTHRSSVLRRYAERAMPEV